MIALDSSALIAFLAGATGRIPTSSIDCSPTTRHVCPPVVLSEGLRELELPTQVAELLVQIPRLEVLPGYCEQAGARGAKVLGLKRRARLADTLIAQSCIDDDIGLVTGDADFRQFVRVGGLRLVGGLHRLGWAGAWFARAGDFA